MTTPDLLLVPTPFEARALFPQLEIDGTLEGRDVDLGSRSMRLVIGGFGLPAAGVRAAASIAHHVPKRVVLAGLAGSFDFDALPQDALVTATELHLDGIGAGEGSDHIPARDLPFPPLPGAPSGALLLSPPLPPIPGVASGPLLSVAAAAGDRTTAERRRRAYPGVLAEDMESWAVALAAREAGVELVVLRAVSNLVGERDPARWRVAEATDRLREGLAALPSRP